MRLPCDLVVAIVRALSLPGRRATAWPRDAPVDSRVPVFQVPHAVTRTGNHATLKLRERRARSYPATLLRYAAARYLCLGRWLLARGYWIRRRLARASGAFSEPLGVDFGPGAPAVYDAAP